MLLSPRGLELAEDEEVFWTVVSGEGGKDARFAALAAPVAEGGEEVGIALSSEDGFDDGLGADSVDVAEDVVELEVHFCEDFLHAPEVVGGFTDEAVAVAGEVAEG